MTQFAVHSLHAPAVELIDGGHTHDGKNIIPLGAPLHVADTKEEAEAWRQAARARPTTNPEKQQ